MSHLFDVCTSRGVLGMIWYVLHAILHGKGLIQNIIYPSLEGYTRDEIIALNTLSQSSSFIPSLSYSGAGALAKATGTLNS